MRELLLFENDAAATKYAAALRQIFATCPGDDFGDSEATVVTLQEAPDGFVGGITYTYLGAPTIGVALVRVAQVDNRLLIATAANEGSDLRAAARRVERELSSVLALIRAD
jgi:hypothetical protein